MSETLSPTLHSLPLSIASLEQEQFVHIISNLLTPLECSSIIQSHQDLIPSNVTPDTKRDREAFDDSSLAELIWSRLEHFYGSDRIQDEDRCWWRAKRLNTRFRLCRYLRGGKFSPHTDGRFMASVNEMSFMAVNMYLNTVPEEWKGATRAITEPRGGVFEVLGSVQPVLGTAAVFRDGLWHDGEELVSGEKYLLRTDVIYEREVLFDFEGIYGGDGVEWGLGLDDEAKGRKALRIAEGLEDAGRSEEAVGWYKKAFRLWPGLENGG